MTTPLTEQLPPPKGVATHDDLPGVEVYLCKIGPDEAHELLELNTKGQRSISQAAVERYAVDMTTYDWIFNGAPILISDTNELIDGQHRLTAIRESGEAQVVLIVRGVSREAMDTVDTNRRRSYADTIKMRDIKNHPIVAAAAGRVWYWFHGNYGTRGVSRVANPLHLSATPSNAQKNYWMDKVEKAYGITFEHAAGVGAKAYNIRPGISSGTYALAWIILSGIDKDLREAFFHEYLIESASSASGYPIVALQNRLARLKSTEVLDKTVQLDAIFRTWNFWRNGKELKTLTAPRLIRFDTLELPDGFEELAD